MHIIVLLTHYCHEKEIRVRLCVTAPLELNLKWSEMECAGCMFGSSPECVYIVLYCPQFVRYFFVGCSLCPVNICYSCASSVHWSVCVHYSFGNIRLIDPFYVRSLFVATGPYSLQVHSWVQSVSQIWRSGDFATGHNVFIFGDVRWPSPAKCDRAISQEPMGCYKPQIGSNNV